jgi:hypothetical protein
MTYTMKPHHHHHP